MKTMSHERSGAVDDRAADLGLAGQLLEMVEHEREMLARALHDELGSNLTAINLDLASVAGQLPEGVARTRLERALRVLKEAVELKRRLIQSLRPSMIDSLGLVATLRMETEAFEARSGIVCAAHFDEEPTGLDPRIAIAIYRLVQECTRRFEADGRATHVAVTLMQDGTGLRLVVESDVTPENFAATSVPTLRARLLHFGGSLVTTTSTEGLQLIAEVPSAPLA